jgi:hypothetical protein
MTEATVNPSGLATLTVGNPVNNASVGDQVEVDVTLFGLTTTLDSYRLDVTFTPGVLQAVATNSGTGDIDNAGGLIAGIARDNVGLAAGGTLVKLFFTAVGPGTCYLAASNVRLLDSAGNEIPFRAVGGSVSVDRRRSI